MLQGLIDRVRRWISRRMKGPDACLLQATGARASCPRADKQPPTTDCGLGTPQYIEPGASPAFAEFTQHIMSTMASGLGLPSSIAGCKPAPRESSPATTALNVAALDWQDAVERHSSAGELKSMGEALDGIVPKQERVSLDQIRAIADKLPRVPFTVAGTKGDGDATFGFVDSIITAQLAVRGARQSGHYAAFSPGLPSNERMDCLLENAPRDSFGYLTFRSEN